MRIRPRYSLLTLLVLTALVAGGVKLWRGPHRVAIGPKPTGLEQTLINKGTALGFTIPEWHYEYDYRQGWQEPQVMSVTSFPTPTYHLITLSSSGNASANHYLYADGQYFKNILKLLQPQAIEQAHCWTTSGREPLDRGTPGPSGKLTSNGQNSAGAECLKSYLLTTEGQLYEYLEGYEYGKVSLDQVLDRDVRARLEEELQKLAAKR